MDIKQQLLSDTVFRRTFASGRQINPIFAAYRSTRAVMWTVIGLNAAVFGAWQYAVLQKDRRLDLELHKQFTTSIQNMRDGRYYTMLTSAFSHVGLGHFAFNMFTFSAFCNIMAFQGIGGVNLAAIVIGSALVGSASWLYHINTRSDRSSRGVVASALGASGVVMGAGAAATCLMPFAPMQIMFIPINIPLWALTLAYAGLDTYYLNSNSSIGHAAHLGGSIFGLMYYAVFLRRFGGVLDLLRRGGRRF